MENFPTNIFTTYIFDTASSTDISKWFLSFTQFSPDAWDICMTYQQKEMVAVSTERWPVPLQCPTVSQQDLCPCQRNPGVAAWDVSGRRAGSQSATTPGRTANAGLQPCHHEEQGSPLNTTMAWVNYQGWDGLTEFVQLLKPFYSFTSALLELHPCFLNADF